MVESLFQEAVANFKERMKELYEDVRNIANNQ